MCSMHSGACFIIMQYTCVFLRFAKKKHKHGIEEYAQIAEKHREDGKQKTKVIRRLVPVRNEAERERYRSIPA